MCHGKMVFKRPRKSWVCTECMYGITEEEFADDFVFWFCDECDSYLNCQEGFDKNASKHICRECGYENDTTKDNMKGMCIDCGRVLEDPDGSLCKECKQIRKEKSMERLMKAGKVLATAAAVAEAVSLAIRDSDSDNENDIMCSGIEDDESDDRYMYPICKSCGALMTEFDDWAWYTCPECGDSVRIIDGKEMWHDEIFGKGKKEHHTDFELADFCHGGDLSED